MAVHTVVTPDCPKCGQEMVKKMKYMDGTQSNNNPFGKKLHWWECESCGIKSGEDPDEGKAKYNAFRLGC